MAAHYLHIDAISKSFAGNAALSGVSLSIAKGEFVTILGPSGCGKTTLLNILSGVLSPDAGRLALEDRDITFLAPEHRNFGMVFQNYALFPNLTVAENIGYGLFALARKEARERVRTLMELTGLDGLEKRHPAELSGGQRQRVALARALAPDPAVLLLDEPLSALDAQVRMSLGQELLRLQRETGVTTVMVTHDQQEALALADRVVLMQEGRIVQTGDPQNLYEKPATPFAAEFIGHVNALTLPDLNHGKASFIRFEEVRLSFPSEQKLARPDTRVGQVMHAALMGSYYRVEVLLNDFRTRLWADVPRAGLQKPFAEKDLVAVTLPEEKLFTWDEA